MQEHNLRLCKRRTNNEWNTTYCPRDRFDRADASVCLDHRQNVRREKWDWENDSNNYSTLTQVERRQQVGAMRRSNHWRVVCAELGEVLVPINVIYMTDLSKLAPPYKGKVATIRVFKWWVEAMKSEKRKERWNKLLG